ncbi:MAG: DUF4062 domain-containing protein, partial [Puniceicoccales bacterium]|nr:DUF4062 domain-containing protein [Puniceicoccales bacterium]
MASRRPRIFVSITSTDLSACRQIVVNALLEMGCTPTGSDTQPPDAGSARAQLRKIIADCDAVLHIAGECSGGDPQTRTPGTPRRSYAQLEYETARELKKPLHVIVCSTKFPYDAHKPEAQDVQALQQAHRQRLLAENPLLATVHKPAELGARVLALKGEFTGSTTAEKSASGDAVLWIGATLSGLLLLGAGVGVLLMETGEQENRRALEKERFQTREATKQQRKKQELQNAQFREDLSALFKDYVARDIPGLTDDARRERAIRAFSKRQNIQPEKVKEIIAWYAGVIKGNPNAGELDLSFATFAEKRFAESAESAGKAIRQFRLELDIADKWREQGRGAEADELRQSVLNNLFLAFRQQAVALIAGGQFKQAADACRLALQETPGEDSDWKRTELHILLGEAALEQAAQTADKAESAAPLQDAAQSFKNALPGSPRDVSARQWAIVQNKQAAALNALAAVSAPGERARLAGSAERVCRNVLEAQIRTTLRREWAAASHNLGAALSGRAAAVDGDRARLLDEAVQAFRNALEVRTRKDLPLEWAQTQSEIAAALHDQAALASDANER